MSMIKFVYFDIGDVVIRDVTSDERWAEFKSKLGIPADKDQEFETWFSEKEKAISIGQGEMNLDFHGIKLTNATFVDSFTKNESLWPIINEIHKKCKVGLLTNTYPGMVKALKESGLFPDVIWDAIIDSAVEGIRKPSKEIYELAEQRAGVQKSEILFTDNLLKNIEAAKSFGWQTLLYNPNELEKSNQELLSLCGILHK